MGEGSPEPTRPRCVWLSDDLCGCIYNALAQAYRSTPEKADEFHARWKAAPENATEAVRDALEAYIDRAKVVTAGAEPSMADAVVAALGGSQETPT